MNNNYKELQKFLKVSQKRAAFVEKKRIFSCAAKAIFLAEIKKIDYVMGAMHSLNPDYELEVELQFPLEVRQYVNNLQDNLSAKDILLKIDKFKEENNIGNDNFYFSKRDGRSK